MAGQHPRGADIKAFWGMTKGFTSGRQQDHESAGSVGGDRSIMPPDDQS